MGAKDPYFFIINPFADENPGEKWADTPRFPDPSFSYQCRSISENLIIFIVSDFYFLVEFYVFMHRMVWDDQ